MKRRGLTVVLAVLLAIAGTVGVLVYVSHANNRALNGQRAVTVIVAKQGIPSGTAAGDALRLGLIGTEVLPASSVPDNVLTQVNADNSALVTDSAVASGQVLTNALLVPANQSTTGLAVPKGMLAVSIQFCVPEAVGGNLVPGANVAVFLTTATANNGGAKAGLTAQTGCTGQHVYQNTLTAKTTLVLPKVLVLAVGQGAGNGSGTNSAGNVDLVTVAVSQADAETLIQATEAGMPYLAMVSPAG
jgi:pilus assembly protein CpaB